MHPHPDPAPRPRTHSEILHPGDPAPSPLRAHSEPVHPRWGPVALSGSRAHSKTPHSLPRPAPTPGAAPTPGLNKAVSPASRQLFPRGRAVGRRRGWHRLFGALDPSSHQSAPSWARPGGSAPGGIRTRHPKSCEGRSSIPGHAPSRAQPMRARPARPCPGEPRPARPGPGATGRPRGAERGRTGTRRGRTEPSGAERGRNETQRSRTEPSGTRRDRTGPSGTEPGPSGAERSRTEAERCRTGSNRAEPKRFGAARPRSARFGPARCGGPGPVPAMRPLPVPLLLLLLSPVPGRGGGCPPCPPGVPEPCDSRCPPCARTRSPAEEEPEEPCPPCPPCTHEATAPLPEGTPPVSGDPRVTPPVSGAPPEPPPGDIIPLYCALLAALVVGLVAYVAFKCWDTCRKKRQLDKARDAGDAGVAADGEKLRGTAASARTAPAWSPPPPRRVPPRSRGPRGARKSRESWSGSWSWGHPAASGAAPGRPRGTSPPPCDPPGTPGPRRWLLPGGFPLPDGFLGFFTWVLYFFRDSGGRDRDLWWGY
ncbi:basic proline-rich protein-like isoform X2 [Corvus cornix cornix]|uniref:basic proline-rich protein-like isoform X2 n=1 Tax=Corvus cornix cornix TaxID=932674 RepID=UPI001950A02D|nr:basic proline-rich protein-like isoform X2 [Corvus cornix cornix]